MGWLIRGAPTGGALSSVAATTEDGKMPTLSVRLFCPRQVEDSGLEGRERRGMRGIHPPEVPVGVLGTLSFQRLGLQLPSIQKTGECFGRFLQLATSQLRVTDKEINQDY